MHPRTKHFSRLAAFFSILSFFCFFGPLIWFGGIAFLGGAAIVNKVALVSSVFVAVVMTAVAALNKWSPRSRVWIVLLGLYFCIDYFIAVILTFAITQIIDELILCPLKRHYRAKASMNREIDARGGI